ncbi:MAG: DUF1385 domain-containing protein [Candidatus Eiseniibacteriota bacterium]|jgi:uncharacterized protein YqhQ
MPESPTYAPIGGQAVIEGVMMRSPTMVATAVRRPDGEIIVKRDPYVSWSKRIRGLGLPILRGAFVLIESMQLGISSLSFSAEQASVEKEDKVAEPQSSRRGRFLERLTMAATIIVSIALGFLLFFWVPLVVTDRVLGEEGGGIAFNLIDGVLRLAVFLAYLWAISLWREMKRVFQYHGAEHKSIAAFEAGVELEPATVAGYSRFHPRCGTSFLLIVMLASILVFMLLGRPETVGDRLERFLLIPLIGGISYELIRLSGRFAHIPLVGLFILPGLWLQRITTREPTLEQLEVAIRSIREVTQESDGKLVPI